MNSHELALQILNNEGIHFFMKLVILWFLSKLENYMYVGKFGNVVKVKLVFISLSLFLFSEGFSASQGC